jgi:hypothetical protein
MAFIKTIQQDMEPKNMELVAVVARTLWLCRNGVVHGGIISHPTSCEGQLDATVDKENWQMGVGAII